MVYVPGEYFRKIVSTVPTHTWLHVAIVYRGPNEGEGITVYHDGINKGSNTTRDSRITVTPSGIVKIGRRFDEPGNAVYGSSHVDELLFFNYQLSQPEIVIIKNTA